MDVFEHMRSHDFGELHFRRDAASGLCAVVAIHDTRLGPALGGCRFVQYGGGEEAMVDALRLARGMTYKAALAGVPHGGGKAVIVKPDVAFDRGALFRAFGQFVESLGGRYITAEDSGTGLEDMEVVRQVTGHVVGTDPGHGGGGDPSPYTALGVRVGTEAAVRHVLGKPSLEGVHVAVQGVGHVGYHLCRELAARGARLTVADIDDFKAERAVREFGAKVVGLDAICEVPCDVFAPCALGSALSDDTIPRLRCKVVAGAANNQLAERRHGDDLMQRGVVYVPDYAINAGGLISVAQEVVGYDEALVRKRTEAIFDTISEILQRAAKAMCPTERVADAMVEERLASAGKRLSLVPERVAND